jgi:hypothetical protein
MKEAKTYKNEKCEEVKKVYPHLYAYQYEDGCVVIGRCRFYGYTINEARRIFKKRNNEKKTNSSRVVAIRN